MGKDWKNRGRKPGTDPVNTAQVRDLKRRMTSLEKALEREVTRRQRTDEKVKTASEKIARLIEHL